MAKHKIIYRKRVFYLFIVNLQVSLLQYTIHDSGNPYVWELETSSLIWSIFMVYNRSYLNIVLLFMDISF